MPPESVAESVNGVAGVRTSSAGRSRPCFARSGPPGTICTFAVALPVTSLDVPFAVAVTVAVLVTVEGWATGVNLMVPRDLRRRVVHVGMLTEPNPLLPNADGLMTTV